MADQTVEIDLSLQVEGPGGAQSAVTLADLQKGDPAAGPGALEGTQAAVRAAAEATVAALAGTLAADVTDRPLRQLGHVAVDNFPAFPAVQPVSGDVNVTDRLGRLLGHVSVDNPTDVSALATSARQDAQTAHLTALAGVDYATGADMADLSAKLSAIQANTADIALDVDEVSLNADAINLNTDGVEVRLDTLNAKDFATQATLAALKARGDLLATEATVAALSGKLPAALVAGRLDVNLGASAVTLQTDPTDDAARLLGHVTVDALPNVTVTNPFGGDVTDRVGRLLGVVSGPLTDAQLRAAAVPVDTELGAAGPLAIEATQAAVLAALGGTLAVNSELPAAATLTDADANPSVPGVGGYLMGWTASAWRRIRVDTSGFLFARPSADASSFGDANALSGGTGVGNYAYNGASWDRLRAAAGAATGTLAVAQRTATSGGLTSFRLLSAATTNLTSVKGSAGQLYGWSITNTTAATKHVKVYNKATVPVIANDAALILLSLAIPPNGVLQVSHGHGVAFSAGIGFAVTGAAGDTDATAVAANDVILNLLYA